MSGLVAVFHPDGRPVERGDIARLLGAIAHRGRDGLGLWHDGAVALGYAHLAATGEAPSPQPLVRDGCAIVFVGRLDNRHEVEGALGPRRGVRARDDPAIALEAYRQWGPDAPARFLGDFAFAIWDGPKRSLVCARDSMGQRPLFYHGSDRLVLVASEPCAILASPEVPRGVNEQVAAEYLTGILRTREATLNASVRRLLPAHVLIGGADGCRPRRYWDFDGAREIRHASNDEYAEHFLEVFSRAVDCRVEGAANVALFLSGGLDSSSIAGVAARCARARHAGLRALALRFPGRACDEGDHIAAVARHTGIPLASFEMVPPAADSYRAEAAATLDVPQYPNGAILDPLRAAARDSGARVVLTGYGGDDWLTGSPAHTTDLLRRGRLLAAWGRLRADARLPGRGYSMAGLARGAVAPIVPDRLRAAVRLLRGAPRHFDWLRPEFRRRTGLDDPIRRERPAGFRSDERADIYAVATSAATMIGDEMDERAAARAGIDQRHPFNDRRLAEFALALPPEQRWAGTETKVVLRAAMRRVQAVPESVLARDDKAEFSSTGIDALDAFGGAAAFERLRTAERGWVDPQAVRSLCERVWRLYTAGDEAYIPLCDALWSILSLELWLEVLETHGAKEPGAA
jgi:asparagine synthase (glutamine-hydrolysing)